MLPAIENRQLFSKFLVKILKHSLSLIELLFSLRERDRDHSPTNHSNTERGINKTRSQELLGMRKPS